MYTWQYEQAILLKLVGAPMDVICRDSALTMREVEQILAATSREQTEELAIREGLVRCDDGSGLWVDPAFKGQPLPPSPQPNFRFESKEQVTKRIMKDFRNVNDLLNDL